MGYFDFFKLIFFVVQILAKRWDYDKKVLQESKWCYILPLCHFILNPTVSIFTYLKQSSQQTN